MFGSWDMKPDRQNFSVLLGHLLPFYPTNNPKNQNFEKMKKKTLEVSSCYTCEPKIMIIFYTFPEIWSMTDVIFIFHFGIFFAILPPYQPKKSKFKKIKKRLEISFTHVYQKLWSDNVRSLKYGARWTDGRMDIWSYWQTKKVTYRGACPT